MAQTVTARTAVAAAYIERAQFGALFTGVPGASPAQEPSGGSPAYARKALSWSSPEGGVATATAVFDLPANTAVRGVGVFGAATSGTYLDGYAVELPATTSARKVTVSFITTAT